MKLETFVFDALPMSDVSVVYETDRIDEFAPIKNVDAPEASRRPPTAPRAASGSRPRALRGGWRKTRSVFRVKTTAWSMR